MTWKSKTMPDDALTDCLVGSMLKVPAGAVPDPGPLHPGRVEVLPDMDRPLRELMFDAWIASDHYGTSRGMADVLDLVRDWLVPDQPEPRFYGPEHVKVRWWEWRFNSALRERLSEQARIARGEG